MKLLVENDEGVTIEIQEIECIGDGNCLILKVDENRVNPEEATAFGKYVSKKTKKEVLILPSYIDIIGTV